MKNKLFLTSILCLLGSFGYLSAQKFGHVNSAMLIEVHPKVASANTELEAFQKSIMEPYQVKTRDFESRYIFFLEEVNAGTISKVTAQSRQAELMKEQEALKTEEQQLQFSVMQKREQLLQPILTEIDSVIQALGKEEKYTMIFDTSVSGALLYAQDSDNLTEILKAKIKQQP